MNYYIDKKSFGNGFPLSPVVANIFLDFMRKNRCPTVCPNSILSFTGSMWMTVFFLIINESEHAPLYLDYLNSKHQNINFTMETESNKSLF